MDRVLLIALVAALNPTLLTVTTLMLLLPNPRRLMLGYLCGAMLTSVTIGVLIVFSLSDSGTVDTTRRTLSPVATIALGVLQLVIAWVLATGRGQSLAERRRRKDEPPRWQRALSKGSPRMAFVVGAMLTLPGFSYLVGLTRIHKLDYSSAGKVVAIVAFNLVMLILLEGPLISFSVAPEWTERTIERGRNWARLHGRQFAIRGFTIVGALLIAKGVIGLVSQ